MEESLVITEKPEEKKIQVTESQVTDAEMGVSISDMRVLSQHA